MFFSFGSPLLLYTSACLLDVCSTPVARTVANRLMGIAKNCIFLWYLSNVTLRRWRRFSMNYKCSRGLSVVFGRWRRWAFLEHLIDYFRQNLKSNEFWKIWQKFTKILQIFSIQWFWRNTRIRLCLHPNWPIDISKLANSLRDPFRYDFTCLCRIDQAHHITQRPSHIIYNILRTHTYTRSLYRNHSPVHCEFSGLENFGHGRFSRIVRRWKNFVHQFLWVKKFLIETK